MRAGTVTGAKVVSSNLVVWSVPAKILSFTVTVIARDEGLVAEIFVVNVAAPGIAAFFVQVTVSSRVTVA